jgi:hypothetical protein
MVITPRDKSTLGKMLSRIVRNVSKQQNRAFISNTAIKLASAHHVKHAEAGGHADHGDHHHDEHHEHLVSFFFQGNIINLLILHRNTLF